MARRIHIGDLFVEAGLITREKLEEVLELKKTTDNKKRIGEILVDMGYLTDAQIQKVLESKYGIPFIDLYRTSVHTEMANKVPDSMARRYTLVPVRISNNLLFIAMADPFDLHAIEDVETITKMSVIPLFAKENAILHTIDDLYGNIRAEKAIEDFKKENNLIDVANEVQNFEEDTIGNAPIVRLVNSILEQAVNDGASDIHIEPMETEVRARLRVDGSLTQILSIPKKAHAAILTRIKIIGNMNIAEKRIPQDGRCQLNIKGHELDVRISTLPTMYGEKAVMRILDRESFLKPKHVLGFSKENLEKFDLLLKNPHGIILVTGPTGSGKTTTLYTMLSELNKESDNLITVEDPVEYIIKGLNQVQVNPKANLDFASGLRSILRQDPDIIMIGEIRDQETVDIAIRAAITGHLVLSTIHTNSAADTISRLLDMGVEPYMLSASLVGIIAQRLVRKICPVCKREYIPDPEDVRAMGLSESDPTIKFYSGSGCQNCGNTGNKGRMAVHEVLTVNGEVRNLISQGDAASKIREYARKNNIKTIKEECIRLLLEGTISLKEAISVAYSQD